MKNIDKTTAKSVISQGETAASRVKDMIKMEVMGYNNLIMLSQSAYQLLMKV